MKRSHGKEIMCFLPSRDFKIKLEKFNQNKSCKHKILIHKYETEKRENIIKERPKLPFKNVKLDNNL